MPRASHEVQPMPKPLPVKLGKSPLVEALCQIQFVGKIPAHTFFPGLLFATKEQVSDIRQLPVVPLPQQVRDAKPELANIPVIQLKFESVVVAVGDGVVNVSCPSPYIGWKEFKARVIEVFEALLNSEQVSQVNRYSMKYSNILNSAGDGSGLDMLDWTVRVGGSPLEIDLRSTHLRTESKTDEYAAIVTIMGAVTFQAEGQPLLQGTLLDIDTVALRTIQNVGDFLPIMPEALEAAHAKCKEVFFDCLTEGAINELDPVYE